MCFRTNRGTVFEDKVLFFLIVFGQKEPIPSNATETQHDDTAPPDTGCLSDSWATIVEDHS